MWVRGGEDGRGKSQRSGATEQHSELLEDGK